MKFTINFQNYLTPFFQKYSATLKNAEKSTYVERTQSEIKKEFIQQEPTQAKSDNFQDFFNEPPQNKNKSNPFDAFDEKNSQEKQSNPPSSSKISQNFDFSDIGNPNTNSKYNKNSDYRYEKKKPVMSSGQDIGKKFL